MPTTLVTLRRDGIGQMSCNPAIGGLGKGHLVKEVDALGGLMGRAIDRTGIQFRTLNSSRGPAVRASRVQADRDAYKRMVRALLEELPNLTIVEGEVAKLEVTEHQLTAIFLSDGSRIACTSAVVTTGTFLRGLMHTGSNQTVGGRCGDRSSNALSDSLREHGFELGRLKTGTPARIQRSSINFSILEEQPGEIPARPFSIMTDAITQAQVSCWITNTNETAHEIIRANRERSPMFNGQITSGGPRYCPSIEDKVFRFADKTKHTVFLEPEGYESDVVYPNGISTSLPLDVQDQFIHAIRGLESCKIIQPGYAVEYDFVNPTILKPTLETKLVGGLFFAGQINGTSGYEEAAGQGIIAGTNCANFAMQREPLVVDRATGYLGVMIDDLVTLGVDEPYRMFTSRAEYRLILREDNAATRLTPLGREFGLVADPQWNRFERRTAQHEQMRAWAQTTRINPTEANNNWLASRKSAALKDSITIAALVRRPELGLADLVELSQSTPTPDFDVASGLEIELKFEGYLARQDEEARKLKTFDTELIPPNFVYDEITSLRTEAREKFKKHRPYSLGQAMRIPGITPSAVTLLAVYLKRWRSAAGVSQ